MKKNKLTPIHVLIICILLLSAVVLSSCDSSYFEGTPEPGSITGRVFFDEDADDMVCEDCDCEFYLEDVTIELYQETCTAEKMMETTETDADGIFRFENLAPGEYCVSPRVKTICEGFQPTTPIQQHVMVKSNDTVEADWFGFDHALDYNK